VIPTYNQRARTRQAAAEAAAFLQERFGGDAELIVVDDGSRPEEALEQADLPPGTTLVRYPVNLGKGGAVRAGVAQARGEYIVYTDSDLPFTLDPIPTTLAWLRDGADIVIGDRLLPESQARTAVTPVRQLSSVIYTWLVNYFLGLPLPDTQAGYKGYRGSVAKALFGKLQTTSFAFEAEILVRAKRAGHRVRRQPVHLVHNEDTSVNLRRHAPRMFLDTLRIGWRARRGRL
jgi:dolichyl-phosphate beta-glucosyltransferase